jgi:hypothetical protein
MDDRRRAQAIDQRKDCGAIPDVAFVMLEAGHGFLETALVPARVPLRTKEHAALVVIDTVNPVAGGTEVLTNRRPDQPGRAGYEQ